MDQQGRGGIQENMGRTKLVLMFSCVLTTIFYCNGYVAFVIDSVCY